MIDAFSKREMVLKRCNVDREESMLIVKKEINILQRFANQYMVNLIASDILQKNRTSREALLLMDFYPGGHLLDRLNMRNGSSLPSESAFRIFGQLLLSLKPLHLNNPPIVHRDLKLENILFGSVRKFLLNLRFNDYSIILPRMEKFDYVTLALVLKDTFIYEMQKNAKLLKK